MRTVALAFAALAASSSLGLGQDISIPGIMLGGSDNSAFIHQSCVEVEIGDAKAFDCLNSKLQREVDRVSPVLNMPPIGASSPDIKIGIVNMPAVRQQYGRNFGNSVIPYRPGAPVFTSPLGPRH